MADEVADWRQLLSTVEKGKNQTLSTHFITAGM